MKCICVLSVLCVCVPFSRTVVCIVHMEHIKTHDNRHCTTLSLHFLAKILLTKIFLRFLKFDAHWNIYFHEDIYKIQIRLIPRAGGCTKILFQKFPNFGLGLSRVGVLGK
jgi:hypothetical protein